MSKKGCAVVLDLGTSSFKCGNVTSDARVIYDTIENFPLFHDDCIYETDFEVSFDRSLVLLQKAVQDAYNRGFNIEAILFTSQAQTFAPVDKKFNSISPAMVWLDTRAQKEAEELNQRLERFQEMGGFARVLPALYISKLLWLKKNKQDIFNNASYYPLINEYIAYRLTNHFYSDYTNFGMSGAMDIRTRELNSQVLDLLGLSDKNFPEISDAAGLSYPVTPDVKNRIGLRAEINVYLCGNDQSASSAGSGLKNKGDVSVNFGTAMVVYALIDQPVIPDEPTQIVGINPMGGYFLMSVEDNCGNVIEKTKNDLLPDLSYDEFFLAASDVTNYFVQRFLYHISVIERFVIPNNIYISGGLTQSRVWTDIIREKCKYEVHCINTRESGLIGVYNIYRRNKDRLFLKGGCARNG